MRPRSGSQRNRRQDGDGDDNGVLGASSCSAGRREEKSAVSSRPEPSRAGPRLASPYYHVGWYREGILVQQSGGGLPLGTVLD